MCVCVCVGIQCPLHAECLPYTVQMAEMRTAVLQDLTCVCVCVCVCTPAHGSAGMRAQADGERSPTQTGYSVILTVVVIQTGLGCLLAHTPQHGGINACGEVRRVCS